MVAAVVRVHHGRLELGETPAYPVVFSLMIPEYIKQGEPNSTEAA